jgi:hypothetical protein
MTALIAFHEVEDVDHWLSSPRRAEFFGPMGVKVRTFRDIENSSRTALLLDVPDMAAFQEALESEEAADAMKVDGVRRETLVILAET